MAVGASVATSVGTSVASAIEITASSEGAGVATGGAFSMTTLGSIAVSAVFSWALLSSSVLSVSMLSVGWSSVPIARKAINAPLLGGASALVVVS